MASIDQLQKPHAVIVPYPSQGHINPLMQFAKLLHARGFHITFVNTEFNHKRLIRTQGPDSVKGLPDFRYEIIPDGLPPSDKDATQDVAAVCDSTRKHSLAPFRELLVKLNSSLGMPPVTCIVSDGVMSFTMLAAKELGIPEAQFWTASACGLMGYFQYVELVKRGLIPLKDESFKTNGYLDTPLDWIPGMKGMRLKDMPAFCFTTNPNDIMLNFMIEQMENCTKSSAMIINTFYEFEKSVLDALASYFPHIYTVGPLTQLTHNMTSHQMNSLDPSLWKEDTQCLDWLDKKEEKSVVFVNFGSVAVMTEQQMEGFAWGLANCEFNFLWVLRPDAVMGDKAILPEVFVEETKDTGLIVSWCPQEKVLTHPSVGLFITHAGWNSMLETVIGGVPVLCWAYGAEQTTNSRQVCKAWGNGMEIDRDVKSRKVSELVREMMVGKKGKEKREKALEWKKKAEEATSEGGSSFVNFDRLIKEVLLQQN